MDVFVRALSYTDPPHTFALQTVQEAIKPQRQTKLLLEENQLLENILRTLLRELVVCNIQFIYQCHLAYSVVTICSVTGNYHSFYNTRKIHVVPYF
ncbi:hypothetical protein KSS87_003511 [Heliosperma pusillum]|nr:hypothetical protein KSS87_003511 [Heliosperma pusillum]